jgi:hypothetical protein
MKLELMDRTATRATSSCQPSAGISNKLQSLVPAVKFTKSKNEDPAVLVSDGQ